MFDTDGNIEGKIFKIEIIRISVWHRREKKNWKH